MLDYANNTMGVVLLYTLNDLCLTIQDLTEGVLVLVFRIFNSE